MNATFDGELLLRLLPRGVDFTSLAFLGLVRGVVTTLVGLLRDKPACLPPILTVDAYAASACRGGENLFDSSTTATCC